MLPFVLAVIVLVLLSIKFVKLRALFVFEFLLAGIVMLIASIAERFWLFIGLGLIATAVVILILTTVRVPRGYKGAYIKSLLLCGLNGLMMQIMMLLVITIPFAKIFREAFRDWHEATLLNESGTVIGKRIVDRDNRDLEGNQYTKYRG